MNKITLLEFCQDPNNRILVMEYLKSNLDIVHYFLCNRINSEKFKTHFSKYGIEFNLMVCVGISKQWQEENPIEYTSKRFWRLDELLPELLKYKSRLCVNSSVWWIADLDQEGVEIRYEALTKAIQDIKNNLS